MDKKIFDEYKNITLKIIKAVDNDEDCLELMNKRKEIIESITLSNINKSVIKSIYYEYGLSELDKCLENTIKNKLKETKETINKVAKGKQAINGYNLASNKQNFYSVKI